MHNGQLLFWRTSIIPMDVRISLGLRTAATFKPLLCTSLDAVVVRGIVGIVTNTTPSALEPIQLWVFESITHNNQDQWS